MVADNAVRTCAVVNVDQGNLLNVDWVLENKIYRAGAVFRRAIDVAVMVCVGNVFRHDEVVVQWSIIARYSAGTNARAAVEFVWRAMVEARRTAGWMQGVKGDGRGRV